MSVSLAPHRLAFHRTLSTPPPALHRCPSGPFDRKRFQLFLSDSPNAQFSPIIDHSFLNFRSNSPSRILGSSFTPSCTPPPVTRRLLLNQSPSHVMNPSNFLFLSWSYPPCRNSSPFSIARWFLSSSLPLPPLVYLLNHSF